MRRILSNVSALLFGGISLFLLWFGWTYANVTEMLWFHAAAIPEAVRTDIWPLYDALMNLIGGSSIALGLLGLLLAAGPVRRGHRGMAIALAAAFGVCFGAAALTAETLAKSGAPTSWRIMGVLLAITAGALSASMASGKPDKQDGTV